MSKSIERIVAAPVNGVTTDSWYSHCSRVWKCYAYVGSFNCNSARWGTGASRADAIATATATLNVARRVTA